MGYCRLSTKATKDVLENIEALFAEFARIDRVWMCSAVHNAQVFTRQLELRAMSDEAAHLKVVSGSGRVSPTSGTSET